MLKDENEMNDTSEGIVNLNCTLDHSFFATQSCGGIVIFPSNLKEENYKLLREMTLKHKVKFTSVFRYVQAQVTINLRKTDNVKLL